MNSDERKDEDSSSYRLLRHSYGSAPQQFGMLFLPTMQTGPHPVVMLIHGGFWRAAYGLTLMTGLAEDLVKRGVAVWNIEYRRVGEEGGGWPGTLRDVAQAADLLTELAMSYPLDLERVVAVGHSAGGQLACWLAARPQLSAHSPLFTAASPLRLKGVVSQAGVLDLEQAWQLDLGTGAVEGFLGGTPDEVRERYEQASPAALLPLGISQVLIHGDVDNRVPLLISQKYTQKARVAGDRVTLVELAGGDHFVVIDPRSEAWTMTVREIEKVLR